MCKRKLTEMRKRMIRETEAFLNACLKKREPVGWKRISHVCKPLAGLQSGPGAERDQRGWAAA
jgi:hypothetical protein